ncbi:hypothetical protein RBI80_29370 (plasmid) [Klebsiella variicola]|nr:hypothetical protein RBI80_29370 [Klebsiella variicola]
MWGVESIRNVSASAVAMGAAASIFDGMTTSQLHEALVKSAADLISPETPNCSQVAARLNMFKIRKDAFRNSLTKFLSSYRQQRQPRRLR